MSKEQLDNPRSELRKSKISSHGLWKKALANMPCVDDAIQNHDLVSRKEIIEKSTDCLCVVQNNDWCNAVTKCLYGKNDLTILIHIVKTNILVLCVDSTKIGRYGQHNLNIHKKLLYKRVSIQPEDSFFRKEDR